MQDEAEGTLSLNLTQITNQQNHNNLYFKHYVIFLKGTYDIKKNTNKKTSPMKLSP